MHIKHEEMLDPSTKRYCLKCNHDVLLQYDMVDEQKFCAVALCKRCGSVVDMVLAEED